MFIDVDCQFVGVEGTKGGCNASKTGFLASCEDFEFLVFPVECGIDNADAGVQNLAGSFGGRIINDFVMEHVKEDCVGVCAF